MTERLVDDIENLLPHTFLEHFFLRCCAHVEVVAFHYHLRDFHHLLGNLIRHIDFVFHIVVVLHVSAQPLDVFRVVGIVVERGHSAQFLEAVGQHSLRVHIGKAKWPYHLRHPFLAAIVFHCLHQGFRNFRIIDEVNPTKAHTLALPFLVGVMVDDSSHAASHLPVLVGDIVLGLAKLESSVLLLVQRVHVVAEQVRGIIFVSFVKVVVELHKLLQVPSGGHLLDFYCGHFSFVSLSKGRRFHAVYRRSNGQDASYNVQS